MTKLKSRLTYANVMATIAVFLALGGAATAAFTLPKKSVGAKNLKKDAVTNPKVADAAINSAELGNNAVTEGKLANGAVSNAKIADAAVNGAKVQDASIGIPKTAAFVSSVTQDFGVIAANSCQAINKAVSGVVQKDDYVVVLPDPTVGSGDNEWYGGALFANGGPTNTPPEAQITLHACNGTGVSADPPNTTFRVLVFR